MARPEPPAGRSHGARAAREAGWQGHWHERWQGRWHERAHRRFRHSLRARLVVLFLLLALAMTAAFVFGMQKALSIGWRDAARPLLVDYVDRLAADIGSPPSVERAQALVRRLPVTVRISGPQVQWESHSDAHESHGRREDGSEDVPGHDAGARLFTRTTADGHRIEFGLSLKPWRDRPRLVGWITLAALLTLTALAYAFVRRLLRPLDDIRAGAERFGQGDFATPIPVRGRDELGQLARVLNAMAEELRQRLEAKRALLLAISHELRSPLTRARLNTELLPETPDLASMRDGLLRDLGEMRDLITDLLESERLGQGPAALHLEPTDLELLAREVLGGLPQGEQVRVTIAPGLAPQALDRTRMRLLLRNLLDNALRHSVGASAPPQLSIDRDDGGLNVVVRDWGPGVDDAVLSRLAEPFFRPDAARQRATGGVGLGLYLCKLVAQAHGGELELRNAQPGLQARARLP
jgi:signal transduction histidine kinase